MRILLSTWLCLIGMAAVLAASFLLVPTPFSDSAKQSIRQATASMLVLHDHDGPDVYELEQQQQPQEPLLDLHYCRANLSNAPNRPYLCEGPAYDDFSKRMQVYVKRQNSRTWGRRKFPLPNNTYVFMLGNSHTRQVYNTLLCEYRDVIVESMEYGDTSRLTNPDTTFGSTSSFHFANNATLVTVSNTPLVYNKYRWAKTFEGLLNRSLSSMDAIIMGRFNHFETKSRYGREIISYSKAHPELFDKTYSTPTIESLAELYDGPIVALPMFAPHGQDVADSAKLAQAYWKNATGRTNIYLVDARKHIDVLGECGSDVISEMGTCRNTGDGVKGSREAEAMHRCTGLNGGHPDLVSWDIVEQLYEVLG